MPNELRGDHAQDPDIDTLPFLAWDLTHLEVRDKGLRIQGVRGLGFRVYPPRTTPEPMVLMNMVLTGEKHTDPFSEKQNTVPLFDSVSVVYPIMFFGCLLFPI